MRKPVKTAPLPADGTTPLSDDQFAMFAALEPHYKLQCEKHPRNRWLKEHYSYIVGSFSRGFVHSNEALVAEALSPD